MLVSGPLLTPDHALSRALVRTVPDPVTERLSDLGNVPVAVPVLVLAMAYAARRGRALAAGAAGLAMALVPALVIPFKEWTARPGPLEPWAAGYFPSGHTATAAVAYLGAALLLRPYTRRAWGGGCGTQPPQGGRPGARLCWVARVLHCSCSLSYPATSCS
ncbi:hypothetical protein ACFCXU_22230, partial [Streptomyces virginiae]